MDARLQEVGVKPILAETNEGVSKMSKITEATLARSRLFKSKVDKLGLNERALGRIFGLGNSSEETSIRRKLRDEDAASFRTPSKSDLLSMNLLEVLQGMGVDLTAIQFDHEGNIQDIEISKSTTESKR